jgi:hypothetical protein
MAGKISNEAAVTAFIISSAFSGILFDWHAYGFSFGVGLTALLFAILLAERFANREFS